MPSTTNPLISVIVPVYNVEQYLDQCIQSILAQTYTNLEIILVNDGSPDNCGQICEEYAKQDPRIVVIHKENGGLSDARNAGLDICKGEYISFVDSYDMIHPQFIEILYQNLEENKADISFCDFKRFENSNELVLSSIDKIELLSIDGRFMIDNLYTKEWVPKNVIVCNKLFKRSIFHKLRFPKGLNHEDEYIFLDVYKNNPKVFFVSFIGYNYRYNQDGIMGNKYQLKNFKAFKEITNIRVDYFRNNKDLLNKTYNNFYRYILVGSIDNPNLFRNYIIKERLLFFRILKLNIYWKTKLLFLYKLFLIR